MKFNQIKMKKAAFIVLFLVGSFMHVFAQSEVFKVLVNKGKNTADNKPIFAGSKIYEGQTIQVTDGGYLAMIYKNGKSMEVKTPGAYKVTDLAKQALAASGNFTKKYAELVLNEITKTNKNLTDNRKENMSVTGSVERGDLPPVVIISPINSDLLAHEAKIKWRMNPNFKDGYVVNVIDMYSEPLKSYTTLDTFITVKVSDLNLKSDSKSFIVRVEPKNVKTKTTDSEHGKLIKVLEGRKADDLHKEIKMVKEEAGDESALSKIILASFCEQNKLFLEAIDYYQQAIQIEPTVEEYRYAYENFLLRNKMEQVLMPIETK